MILCKCSSYSRPSELHGYQRGLRESDCETYPESIRTRASNEYAYTSSGNIGAQKLGRVGVPLDHTYEVETIVILLDGLSGMLSELKDGLSTNTGLRWLILGEQ